MFCSNCGKEASGKFCSYCGSALMEEVSSASVLDDESKSDNVELIDTHINVKGVDVNISDIIRRCGKNKIEAIKLLREQTGVSIGDGKNIMDDAYNKLFVVEMEKQKVIEQEKIKSENEHIEQLEREGVAYCPKCHSTSLSSHKKGFGIGKAVIGGALAGGIGLVAGNIGAKKVRVTCMKCGHQFWA